MHHIDVRAAVCWARLTLARAKIAELSFFGRKIEYRDTLAMVDLDSLCYAHGWFGVAMGGPPYEWRKPGAT